MKNSTLYIVLLSVLLLTSCSNDDDNDVTIKGDYFPSTENNYWNYDVTAAKNNETTDSQDFLAVKSSTNTGFELETNSGNSANGTMNALLTAGVLSKTESTLKIKGKLNLPIEGFEDFAIDFNEATLYELNASNNSVLDSFSGEFTKDLQGFPVTVTYELSFNKIQNQKSLKVNNVTYNNITVGNIALNVELSTTIEVQGNDTSFPIIDKQDILSITSYYGENVGLLRSEATVKFDINSTTILLLQTLGVELDLPESQTNTNNQVLTSFHIN